MSVAGPVVPTKEDGEVDQDRSGHLMHAWLYNVIHFLTFSLLVIYFCFPFWSMFC